MAATLRTINTTLGAPAQDATLAAAGTALGTIATNTGECSAYLSNVSAKLPALLGEQLAEESLSVVVAGGFPVPPATTLPIVQALRGQTATCTARQYFCKLASDAYSAVNYVPALGCSSSIDSIPNAFENGMPVLPGIIVSSDLGDVGAGIRVTYNRISNKKEFTEDLVMVNVGGIATATTSYDAGWISKFEAIGPYPSGTLSAKVYADLYSQYETINSYPSSSTTDDSGSFARESMFVVVPAGKVCFIKLDHLTPVGCDTGTQSYMLIEYLDWAAGAKASRKLHWQQYCPPAANLVPQKLPEEPLGPFPTGSAVALSSYRAAGNGGCIVQWTVLLYDA